MFDYIQQPQGQSYDNPYQAIFSTAVFTPDMPLPIQEAPGTIQAPQEGLISASTAPPPVSSSPQPQQSTSPAQSIIQMGGGAVSNGTKSAIQATNAANAVPGSVGNEGPVTLGQAASINAGGPGILPPGVSAPGYTAAPAADVATEAPTLASSSVSAAAPAAAEGAGAAAGAAAAEGAGAAGGAAADAAATAGTAAAAETAAAAAAGTGIGIGGEVASDLGVVGSIVAAMF